MRRVVRLGVQQYAAGRVLDGEDDLGAAIAVRSPSIAPNVLVRL